MRCFVVWSTVSHPLWPVVRNEGTLISAPVKLGNDRASFGRRSPAQTMGPVKVVFQTNSFRAVVRIDQFSDCADTVFCTVPHFRDDVEDDIVRVGKISADDRVLGSVLLFSFPCRCFLSSCLACPSRCPSVAVSAAQLDA